ncbi:hypothetical protein BXZ70DRAFT_633534 [Cristinia sonorae]|uniref:Uncharacterized protein n=1 Tax=Cristinia sonorae TaxID=1940300 RepID=A0A8K0UED0_9AGAR|nr:hypothetical protein BXZ70DRAFT_633534 [Cristinia sonorae]
MRLVDTGNPHNQHIPVSSRRHIFSHRGRRIRWSLSARFNLQPFGAFSPLFIDFHCLMHPSQIILFKSELSRRSTCPLPSQTRASHILNMLHSTSKQVPNQGTTVHIRVSAVGEASNPILYGVKLRHHSVQLSVYARAPFVSRSVRLTINWMPSRHFPYASSIFLTRVRKASRNTSVSRKRTFQVVSSGITFFLLSISQRESMHQTRDSSSLLAGIASRNHGSRSLEDVQGVGRGSRSHIHVSNKVPPPSNCTMGFLSFIRKLLLYTTNRQVADEQHRAPRFGNVMRTLIIVGLNATAGCRPHPFPLVSHIQRPYGSRRQMV